MAKLQFKKKRNLWIDKKGINDVSIIMGIILVFVLVGLLLPYVNADLGVAETTVNIDDLEGDVSQDVGGLSAINAFTLLFSVGKMFFWTFGDLPFWLDGIFVVFRLILAVVIARNVWIGGGA